jgi:hypothetical protein
MGKKLGTLNAKEESDKRIRYLRFYFVSQRKGQKRRSENTFYLAFEVYHNLYVLV